MGENLDFLNKELVVSFLDKFNLVGHIDVPAKCRHFEF